MSPPSASKSSNLTVRILGHEYQVACPEGEREALLSSAEYLDRRMAAIQKKGRAMGMERIAVMTALNMAREMLESKSPHSKAVADKEVNERLLQLQLRIDSALEEDRAAR